MNLLLILLLCLPASAAEPVQLRSYPQKLRTFVGLSDPGVPSGLKADARPLPAWPAQLSRERLPLPLSEVRVASIASDGAFWLGTRQGVMRWDARAPEIDRLQYMAGRRYLPDDEVEQLFPDRAAGMWVRTHTGLSHIELKPMTLAAKAEVFEERIRLRHNRYGLVSSSNLMEPGNPATNRLDPSDNDGLWTAMYAAGEWFRYAVTKSTQALDNARQSTEAVMFLEQVTQVSGLPARSYIKTGDWRAEGGIWHRTPDRLYEWKADTSSDELVGHFFLLGIAWDLCPDPAFRKRVAGTAIRIMDHIVRNGYNLIDITGQPTYWGQWSPEYFLTRRGHSDAPLNSIELLSFLKTTAHITGQAKYESEYRKVALDMKYAAIAGEYLKRRQEINYSDEELAMLPYYLLFQYEKDPVLLNLYRQALDGWWRNIRREQNPLWTAIYLRSQPQGPVDLAAAVHTLYRIPMDLIEWTVHNSHRGDIAMETQQDRFRRPQAQTFLPPDERAVSKWNGNPFRIDGGNGGRGEDDGAFFLLPYWLGRYHRYFKGE